MKPEQEAECATTGASGQAAERGLEQSEQAAEPSLTERRRQERTVARELRREQILTGAMECFCENGIAETALSEIAARAQVGEATLYRYFATKEALALDCGIAFWQRAVADYAAVIGDKAYQEKTGLAQIAVLLSETLRLFQEQRNGLRFLYELDRYLTAHQLPPDQLMAYEALINRPKPFLCDAIRKGRQDGTIRIEADAEELYYTLTHTVLSLMQKLAATGQLLEGDGIVTAERRLALLLTLLTRGLGAEE